MIANNESRSRERSNASRSTGNNLPYRLYHTKSTISTSYSRRAAEADEEFQEPHAWKNSSVRQASSTMLSRNTENQDHLNAPATDVPAKDADSFDQNKIRVKIDEKDMNTIAQSIINRGEDPPSRLLSRPSIGTTNQWTVKPERKLKAKCSHRFCKKK